MSAQTTDPQKLKSTSLTFASQFLAGAIAGVVEVSCMYPLDVVKTRFQLQVTTSRSSTIKGAVVRSSKIAVDAAPYTSIFGCLRRIIQQEGVLNLYRGALPPILVEAPRRAIKFEAYEQWGFIVKKILSVDQLTATQAGFVGSMAGATEAFLVTPFDLVKVRLQDKNGLETYRGTFDCIRKIGAQEGILTFYHGFESTVWRHATWSGAYFMTTHLFRSAFPQRSSTSKNESMLRNFIAGTIGGIFGTLISTPFDVVKSRIQNQRNSGVTQYGFALPSIARIYREEGFRALYKGLAPKIVRLGPGGGLLLIVFDRVSGLMRRQLEGQADSPESTTLAS